MLRRLFVPTPICWRIAPTFVTLDRAVSAFHELRNPKLLTTGTSIPLFWLVT
jgi:hypothetical protein